MVKLLLHICCGPCAIMPAMRLRDAGYEITLWFMNPNIQPLAEYLRRRESAGKCASCLGLPIIYDDQAWDLKAWLHMHLPLADSPGRCESCIALRLDAALKKAVSLDMPFFSTSLLYSRYQPHEFIANYGEGLSFSKCRFVYRDFRGDWQKGIDQSVVWELYRQPYCGCVFSETERYAKKLKKLQAAGTDA